ncbi:hypothetical protein H6F44_00940 [Pseudanabaena sp. FACHB-1277]|uniref:Lon proteolytic domain-containing protein n=1 Tax=Pseudanabaena cinerea FACHB-1277 TaxID=2949581 RepID=A0A926Z6G1_9CYAN|nr:S16 family serine protease [Pseudanabaena cinerea]MBD2148699.1 hypothetical protein [Pseudanabaena cinerea FACHB-1277]
MRRKGKTGGGSNKPRGNSGKKPGMFNRPKSGASPKSSSPFRNPTNKGNPIALVLGIFFAVAAITGTIIATNPNLISQIAGGSISCSERSVTVNALSTKEAIPVKLSVSPNLNSAEIMPVKFTSKGNNEVGKQLKTSANLAAVMTSFLLGEDLSNCQFTVETQTDKDVDGPSAGALFTVSFLSLVRGDNQAINPKVTMTGTVNPDGTVGPVGGIPGKLKAADNLRDKKSLGNITVIIPRQSDDKITQADTELTNLSVEIAKDIYGAYKLLTGKEIPRYLSKDISLENLKLSEDISTVIGSKIKEIEGSYKTVAAIPDLIALKESTKKELSVIGQVKDAYYKQFETYKKGGNEEVSSAFNRLNQANFAASIHKNIAEFASIAESNDRQKLKNTAEKNFGEIRQLVQEQIRNLEKSTKENLPFTSFVDSYSHSARAKSLVEFSDKSPSEISEDNYLIWALGNLFVPEMARKYLNQSKVSLDIGKAVKARGNTSNLNKKKLIALAKILDRAARSNIEYLKSLVGEPNNLSYYLAFSLKNLSDDLIKKLEKIGSDDANLADVYDLTGSALSSYLESSMLIYKYYSLQAGTLKATDIFGNLNFSNMNPKLSFEQQQAAIREIKETVKTVSQESEDDTKKFIAVLKDKNLGYEVPAFNYWQSQPMARSEDVNEQLDSISGFWAANFEARIALMAAGIKP